MMKSFGLIALLSYIRSINAFTTKLPNNSLGVVGRAPVLKLFSSDKPEVTEKTVSSPGVRKTAIIAGATGYIGKAVVRESVRQGYNTIALVRDKTKVGGQLGGIDEKFDGAKIVECDVTDPEALQSCFREIASSREDCGDISIVSCLASRSGIKKDAFSIDYQATLNCLEAGRDSSVNAKHFVLLSAFCVRKPLLQFQKAKLKFEAALQEQNDLTWSIVRPTAYFKSVSGQMESIQSGKPFLIFCDGQDTACNAISEFELAEYLVDCIADKSRENRILNLGGSGEPITKKQQGEMLFEAIGKEPNFLTTPLWLFDSIIDTFQVLSILFKSEKLENAAELGRILQYYAMEDMVTTEPDEKFGKITLQEHYNKIAEHGQEFDPYTTGLGIVNNYAYNTNT